MENNKSSKSIRLESLNITNFATFKSEQVSFKKGFNSIVGETGSGKSLILDALQFILGQRADKKIIRKGSDFASLEAVFSCHSKKVAEYFMNMGFPFEDNEIVIKRIIQSSGKSKSYINHQNCTIKNILDFSNQFIDFVGQFSNQKLLNDKYQLEILDSYAGLLDKKNSYYKVFNQLCEAKKQLKSIQESEIDRLRKLDYLKFQVNEIEELSPSIESEKKLIESKSYLQNFERKNNLNQEIMNIIDHDNSLLDLIRRVKLITQSNEELFKSEQLDFIDESLENFSALHSQLSQESTQSLDLSELELTIDQLDAYQKIKRKLGPEISDVLNNHKSFMEQINTLEGAQKELETLEVNIKKLEKQALRLAQSLTKSRTKYSIKFAKELCQKLRKLNMPEVKIEIEVIPLTELCSTGQDKLFFKIETNPGEGMFLLQDVASGGELSRILLSIREIHARENNNISIFLFDEIDTGIGGSTAVVMGEELKDISRASQVIAITHLPQIAQFSDFLIEVSKKTQGVTDKRTESFIKEYQAAHIQDFAKEMTPLN